jgi:hypothetical protein
MVDHIILELADGWALGFDFNQWILFRRRNLRTQSGWKPVAFIASNKIILRRVLREAGVQPNPKASKYLDAMPDTFREWLSCQDNPNADPEAP